MIFVLVYESKWVCSARNSWILLGRVILYVYIKGKISRKNLKSFSFFFQIGIYTEQNWKNKKNHFVFWILLHTNLIFFWEELFSNYISFRYKKVLWQIQSSVIIYTLRNVYLFFFLKMFFLFSNYFSVLCHKQYIFDISFCLKLSNAINEPFN